MATTEKPGAEIVRVETLEDLAPILLGELIPEYDDPDEIQRAIIGRILTADTVDQVFGDQGTVSSKDMIDVPIRVMDCRIMRSSYVDDDPSAFGAYIVVDFAYLAGDRQGEVGVMTTGARKIMAQMVVAKIKGFLPADVKVIEAGKAKGAKSAPLAMTAV